MLHEIGRELETKLGAQGCPLKVVDGPEATTSTTWSRERVVIGHDEDGRDSFSGARTQSVNPVVLGVLNQAVKISIYAQASAPGAAMFEHRRRSLRAAHMIYIALEEIRSTRKNGVVWTGGRFVQPFDLEKSPSPAGAVYEMTLTWERGISKLTWAGADQDEFTITATNLTSTSKASLASGPDDDDDPNTVPATAETI